MPNSYPRILIVDDELPARNRLKDLLDDCRPDFPFELVGEACNGREAVGMMNQVGADIVFLDIRMPVMDGLETARHLQKLQHPPAIVFTTALDNHALDAFELNAVDYLLKPVRSDRLLTALKKAVTNRRLPPTVMNIVASQVRTHLSVTERERVTLVPVADICYMRAELKYVTLKTMQREYLLEESLINLEKEFGDIFVRIHRSCLVARKFVSGFEKIADKGSEPHWVVLLKDLPEKLPVSRRQSHVVKEF